MKWNSSVPNKGSVPLPMCRRTIALAAMVGSTAVCLLHLAGREPTHATALQVGVGSGVVVFCLVRAYGWSFRRALAQRRG
jgi:hypothetical protein